MIRSLWLNTFIGIHTIIFCIWGFILSLFDKKDGKLLHLYAAVPWARIILWVGGVRGEVIGKKNIVPNNSYIFMCNHQSFVDIFVLLANIPTDFKFIMKKELMSIPILGPCMRRAGYMEIERDDPRESIKQLSKAIEKIKKGISVLIFPEGTRSPDGKLLPFKKGGFYIAVRSGCDVVPLYIQGTHPLGPKGSWTMKKGKYKLIIGEPVSVKDYGKKDAEKLMKRIRDIMIGMSTL